MLPGNIIGPAIASAYCAAAAGASVILKSAADERALSPVVAAQFEALGPPLAGTVEARYWKGGDAAVEASEFGAARTIVAFGTDAAIAEIARRAGVPVRGYGASYSIALVAEGAELAAAADRAARDVALFDQRGCMSPQTIYVEGDEGRALLFARALASSLGDVEHALPRSRIEHDEAASIAAAVRRLALRALAPKTHGLDTLMLGPEAAGVPSFVVVVEPDGPPTLEGFGRIVAVKPCAGAKPLATTIAAASPGICFETLGHAGEIKQGEPLTRLFRRSCALGEMQRPPFGHRPAVEDFA